MKDFFLILHLAIAIGLIGLILLQSSQGGLVSSLSSGAFYRSKRGAERIIFIATIVFAFLFLFTSILTLVTR